MQIWIQYMYKSKTFLTYNLAFSCPVFLILLISSWWWDQRHSVDETAVLSGTQE